MEKSAALVVFGATGDLMSRKIAPSLFHLFEKGQLPENFSVIGFARRDLKDEGFRSLIRESITKHLGHASAAVEQFIDCFSYHRGTFENEGDYKSLNQRLGSENNENNSCANKMFYLAVPPEHYETILNRLVSSGLVDDCSPEKGWTRVLVEKPFGKDMVAAQALDRLLSSLFEEEQVYRIDHYLAKE
ncbi:MAG TPA: glucose-6-phosphate dehydrogenase, partial [Actinobacteria bacterium]|nr:glucose-6-phosphate dehydrogenase [Actinomycetota bacterium]